MVAYVSLEFEGSNGPVFLRPNFVQAIEPCSNMMDPITAEYREACNVYVMGYVVGIFGTPEEIDKKLKDFTDYN